MMEKREKMFLENAWIITEKEFNELEKESTENEDENFISFDVTLSGLLMNFDGLETDNDFKNYVESYENELYKIVENDNENVIVGYGFHSIL